MTLHSVHEPYFQKKLDPGISLSSEAFWLIVYSYRTPGLASWKRSCNTHGSTFEQDYVNHSALSLCAMSSFNGAIYLLLHKFSFFNSTVSINKAKISALVLNREGSFSLQGSKISQSSIHTVSQHLFSQMYKDVSQLVSTSCYQTFERVFYFNLLVLLESTGVPWWALGMSGSPVVPSSRRWRLPRPPCSHHSTGWSSPRSESIYWGCHFGAPRNSQLRPPPQCGCPRLPLGSVQCQRSLRGIWHFM